MAIESRCGGCGIKLQVADEHAGKQARCPECGHLYVVGDDPDAENHEEYVAEIAEPPSVNAAAEPEEAANWYVKTPEGQIYGPVSRIELEKWTTEGRVSYDCKLRKTTNAEWQPAWQEFSALKPPDRVFDSPNPFSTPPNASTESVYRKASVSRGNYKEAHRGVPILILGIASFAFCPLAGIPAWIMGSADLQKMKVGIMDPEGKTLTTIGMVIGIVMVVINVLAIGFILFVLLIAGAANL